MLPDNFFQLVGGVFALASLVSVGWFVFSKKADQAIRMAGILLIAMLALFADHWGVYFAATFIIATSVTELDFLQNLAAIVRGNSDYFKYKIEELSQREIIKKTEKEQETLGSTDEESGEPLQADVDEKKARINTLVEAETNALDRMEEYFDASIKRNVRVSAKGASVELDGLIPSVVDDMVNETIIEVKYLRSPRTFGKLVEIFPTIEEQAKRYCKIANKIAKLHLVVIVEGEESLQSTDKENLKMMIDRSSIAAGYSIFTTAELGIGASA